MKTIIKQLLIVGLIFPTLLFAQNSSKKDSSAAIECLKVTGLALDEKSFAIDGVEVRLFKQNDMMEQIEITSSGHHDHSFTFTLDVNEYYTVKVSKSGFVERWIVFYTELPKEMSIESLYSFEFDVVLFKEKQMDDYYLDFPIALISFNKKTNVFESNAKYTKDIKSKIKEAEEAAKLKCELSKKSFVKN